VTYTLIRQCLACLMDSTGRRIGVFCGYSNST